MRTLWHLGVALGFITAYVTSDAASFGDLHVWIGYGILAALGIRLIMGLTGGRFAFTVLRAKRPRWAWIGPVLGMLVVAAIVMGGVSLAGGGQSSAASRPFSMSDDQDDGVF